MKAFIVMWLRMLDEEVRELNYMAAEAGISFNSTWNAENIGFQLFSYNDGYHQFFAEIFKGIHSFVPTLEFFESKKTQIITSLKNQLMAEPNERLEV